MGAFWWSLAFLVGVVVFFLLPVHKENDERVPRIASETISLQVAMRSYHQEFGTFPSGGSRAICLALQGANPKGTVFIELGRKSVSSEGDLLDPWGTAYRIYFSGEVALVHSAGPNKRFEASSSTTYDDYIR